MTPIRQRASQDSEFIYGRDQGHVDGYRAGRLPPQRGPGSPVVYANSITRSPSQRANVMADHRPRHGVEVDASLVEPVGEVRRAARIRTSQRITDRCAGPALPS
jgi:hypothetical protein